MFERDQPRIAKYAQSSPDGLAEVATFVFLTIQQSIETIPVAMRDVRRAGSRSRFLWGMKAPAYEAWQADKERIHHVSLAIFTGFADPDTVADNLVGWYATMPGMGPVKAGFLVQLAFGMSGCLDTHNLDRFGLDEYVFKSSRYKALRRHAARAKMIRSYNETCDALGGTQALWDGWCTYVADKTKHLSPSRVSALHCEAIGV